MKLQILSDQHLEFKQNLRYFISRCHKRADTLLIAGDLLPYNDKTYDSIVKNRILTKWKNTIVIPGNHEFYGSDVDDPFFGSAENTISLDNGNTCHYVNNKVLEINGIYYVCSTLWSYVDPINAYEIQNGVNDYHKIGGLTVDKMNEIHMKNREWFVEAMNEIPEGKRCIVMTHHVPSYNFISERWRGNRLNDAFSADMDVFIMNYGHKISHWIHGHSHDFLDTTVNGIRFIRNPMGYPQERNCDMDMVIEV